MSQENELKPVYRPQMQQVIEATQKFAPGYQRVPWIVQMGTGLGYIHFGWDLVDYMKAAVLGSSYDELDAKRTGFENIVFWGKQGTGKSNLALQKAYEVYGDWDVVLKRVALEPADAIKFYRETRQTGKRIPLIIMDDITTIFPKQLWFVSQEMFTLLQQFIATVRMRFSCIISTSPLPQNLISSLAENLTFEVMVTPNKYYLVERYMWLPDENYPARSFCRKVVVEYAPFYLKDVPSDVWNEYEEKRWRVTDVIVEKLEKKINLSEDRIPVEVVKKSLPSPERVLDSLRNEGYHFSQNKMHAITKRAIELIAELAAKQQSQ